VASNRIFSDAELRLLKQTNPEVGSVCPTCRDKEFYLWLGERHECACSQQKRLHTLYSHAGIGLTYQRLTWDDLEIPDEQLEPVQDYIKNADAYIARGIGLFLSGPMGCGKTLIANMVLKGLIVDGYDCYATTFSETVESFTATWGDNEEKKRFAQRFMRSKVLLLDDLGKEFRSRNNLSATTFDMILRKRVFEARPTILTTNLSPIEVRSGYGAAVLSLLVEQSIEVPLTGGDYRAKAHERVITEVRAGEVRPIV
jgi:DNA replication protein DnaC